MPVCEHCQVAIEGRPPVSYLFTIHLELGLSGHWLPQGTLGHVFMPEGKEKTGLWEHQKRDTGQINAKSTAKRCRLLSPMTRRKGMEMGRCHILVLWNLLQGVAFGILEAWAQITVLPTTCVTLESH